MWNGNKIAYICATFFGTRRGQSKGTTNRYAEWYLPALQKHATCIDRVIVPCNVEEWHAPHYEELQDMAKSFEDESGIPVVTASRPNGHFSYGAWNMALREHCDDIDFAFLMEDDYIVCKPGFDQELLDRYYSPLKQLNSKDKVLFCASWFFKGHASVSNGLINVALFRKYGNEFYLNPANVGRRNEGPQTQSEFLRSFADKGLCIRNMAAEYKVPFNSATGRGRGVRFLGNPNGPPVFMPIEADKDQIEAFLNEVHSSPAELVVCKGEGGFDILTGGAAL
tara:strand:- start:252 stop:1094 length:843 start_codon:yes stop_codon:yes gene_type:complete